nr:hypothetical protein [Pandoravirus belohorizontensis]
MHKDASENDNTNNGYSDNDNGPTTLTALPIELVAMIVNGRDHRGRAFMDPRWRPMARMACRLLRRAVERPTAWDSDALGDPQRLFRRPMVDAGDTYVDLDTTHARRRRWRCGMLVCASAVAEWLGGVPTDLAAPYADTVVDRMVTDWGAARAQAHITLLATCRPDAVAYALDPTTRALFASVPPVPARPARSLRPYDPAWQPDGQELAYAMLDIAVRRCPVDVFEAVVAAIDALYPDNEPGAPKGADGEDEDGDDGGDGDVDAYRHPERRGLWRAAFHHSVLAFDRADIARAAGSGYAHSNGISYSLCYGAAGCIRHCMQAKGVHGGDPESARFLAEAVDLWVKGRCYIQGGLDVALPVWRALDAIPASVITPNHRKDVALKAIRDGDSHLVAWALGARDCGQVSARVLFRVTGLDASGLVCHALGPPAYGCMATVRRGVGHLAGATRAITWLCDTLAYAPSLGDMGALARACTEQVSQGGLRCCVARVAFALARWPVLLWESGHGVPLVRDVFVFSVVGRYPTPEAVILIDAIETWCDALDVDRQAMRDALALLRTAAAREGGHKCTANILMTLYGSTWTDECSSVCYGTCRGSPPDPSRPFCNGRSRSDADAVAAWCLPAFAADRWPL